jgi:hypothetical protein
MRRGYGRGAGEEDKKKARGERLSVSLNSVFCTYRGTTGSGGTSRATGTSFTLRGRDKSSGSECHPEHSWQTTPAVPPFPSGPSRFLGHELGKTRAVYPTEPHLGLLGKLYVREEDGEVANSHSPCHQGHQQDQEDQWGQSDHGRHLCQENHQHLWDQHHPKNREKPETSSVGPGSDL